MCEIYVKSDPILYECRSRSLRIHGAVTTIRLENHFWDVLAEIAAGDGMTTNQLIARLSDEVLEHRGELPNLASFLRVSCMRYLTSRGAERATPPVPGNSAAEPRVGGVVRLAAASSRG
jgi:predicted DNA-binding ribbon-helix-helix protein